MVVMKRDSQLMKTFWDSKARENARYYVSSFRPYDDQNWEEFWKSGEILAERFLAESGIHFTGAERVLEIGCGIGRMTRYFGRRFGEVYGIDVSPEMIAQARNNLSEYKNVSLHVGNGHDLEGFSDDFFDFVFSYITFQHIPKAHITQEYVQDAGRVLKPGAYFYFQVNNLPIGIRYRLRLRSRVASMAHRFRQRAELDHSRSCPAACLTGSGPTELDHPAWRGSRVSISQIRRACDSGGLKILEMNGQGTQYLWVKAVKQ